MEFIAFKMNIISISKFTVYFFTRLLSMTLPVRNKMLLHGWVYVLLLLFLFIYFFDTPLIIE